MSKTTLIQEIQREINNLNDVIDLKIIRGLPYKNEARRHRFLVAQLSNLSSRPKVRPIQTQSFFARFAGALTSFMF